MVLIPEAKPLNPDGGGGGGEPKKYLKSITKDEINQKIIIKDKEDKETEFPYGGGGGSKPNAYASITPIREYAHQLVYTDINYQGAYEFFEQMKPAANVIADDYKPQQRLNSPIGACDAFDFFGMPVRMYDWNYNNQESLIVKTPAMNGRKAVIGVGYNSVLTKDVVESGEYNEAFDVLPFELVDGMNEDGLYIAMLVVPNDYGITTGTVPSSTVKAEVSTLMFPRYMLDNARSVNEVLLKLDREVSVYNVMPLIEMGYEIHYYVGDAHGNFGVIEFINNSPVYHQARIATNFYISGVEFNQDGSVYTPATQDGKHDAKNTNQITDYGSGLERYNLINSRLRNIQSETDLIALIQDLCYTNAYKRTTDPFWYTEFVGGDYKVNTDVKTYDAEGGIVERAIAEFGRRDRATGTTWQTVHGAIYDLESKQMYLVFQEDVRDMSSVYQFGLNYYTAAQIDSLLERISDGNIKYSEYQNLEDNEFNQVMENLKLDARIDTNYESNTIYENHELSTQGIENQYTIPNVDALVFDRNNTYDLMLTLDHFGTGNISGRPKTPTQLALDGELAGITFTNLEYSHDSIIITYETSAEEVPDLIELVFNEIITQTIITPIRPDLIPHDTEKQDKTDGNLETENKTVVGSINEVNMKVENRVNKTDSAMMLYGTDAAGDPALWGVSSYARSSTVPVRDSNGALQTVTATNDDDAVNLGQMNEALEINLEHYVKDTDFATYNKAGVHKVSTDVHAIGVDQTTGFLYAITKALSEYLKLGTTAFISKGTLENLLAGGYFKDNDKIDKASEVPFLLEYADGTSETLYLIQFTPANNNAVDEVDNQGGELDG